MTLLSSLCCILHCRLHSFDDNVEVRSFQDYIVALSLSIFDIFCDHRKIVARDRWNGILGILHRHISWDQVWIVNL